MDFGRGWRRMDDVKRKQVVDGIWAVWEDFFVEEIIAKPF
jgi:hypothetical protein